jgi:hypothetical protein
MLWSLLNGPFLTAAIVGWGFLVQTTLVQR